MRRLRKNNQTPEALKLLGFSVVLAFSACDLSADAKLLYCLFLDRMGVSARNGWKDEQGRIYIHYTLVEIQEDLRCSHGKAVKLLATLDGKTGVGLIERIRQGQGRPTRIYVKQFAANG